MYKIRAEDIKIGNLNVRYFTGGRGTPLVLVHGGADGVGPWTQTLGALATRYTVYAPDLPGWGGSQRLEGDYFIPELVKFVDDFTHSIGLEKFYLMGHSLGGGIALTYTLKHPEKVEKLVLVNSLCLSKDIALWIRLLSNGSLMRMGSAMARVVFGGVKWFTDSVLDPFIKVNFVYPFSELTMSLGSKVANSRQQVNVLTDRLCEISAPTLLVWGSHDAILPVRQAYVAAKLFPNCQVSVLEGGHSVYREKSEEFSRVLGGFLG